MRRFARLAGTLMIVAGLGSIGWAVAVWQWQDPFTAIYTKWQQRQLASSFDDQLKAYQPPQVISRPTGPEPRSVPAPDSLEQQQAKLELAARQYRLALKKGAPVGRLKVPRMGLNAIVVNGTDDGTLKSGPGREPSTYAPGEGELVYVAGHRTTYGAPFAKIDKLRPGDRVTFELPYATFEYEITGHRIVKAHEIEVLRSKHRELLALQACHPRFFASHRWIAYAKPVRVIPREGEAYSLRGGEALAAPIGVA